MSVALTEVEQGNLLEVHVTGKLDKETYETFVPAAERQIQENGKIRFLFAMHVALSAKGHREAIDAG